MSDEIKALAEKVADYCETAMPYSTWTKRDCALEAVRITLEDARDDARKILCAAEQWPQCGHQRVLRTVADILCSGDENIVIAARRLTTENTRHQKANLVRAVLDGYGPLDEAVTEAINAADFDVVPWRVAQAAANQANALTAQLEAAHTALAELRAQHPDNLVRACELCDEPFDGEGVCWRHASIPDTPASC